jgi:hypothetical protein
VNEYRRRLGERGLARFEVMAPERDRDLIRALARRLADDDAEALRAEIGRRVLGEARPRGGVLAALRRSPLVGAELRVTRDEATGRDVAL